MRVHYPTYRRPGRKTDVCSHCRTFKRHIIPRAEKEYKRRRAALVTIFPKYFETFDADSATIQLLQSSRMSEVVVRAWKYISSKNSQSATDPSRKDLSRGTRLELFEAEAKACHKLKGHCELLEAYTWHQKSAEQQREFAKELLAKLPANEAYMHFDFKENVLDHDSQMAKLLMLRILEVVRGKPEYEWSKVKRLHLVCDCGPHFRSRESYAFYLRDLPQDKVAAAWREHLWQRFA
ncbi:unnamed protein product [Durusdinium trenchii]|uniref:Uncharacterized protein n=1 Tax=Durusdinium trenchii TaxID=1381693 RepID=A0ABP0JH90_9DINO